MLRLCSSFASKAFIVKPTVDVAVRSFHRSIIARGFEEFYDPKIAENELISNGRSWTVPDLRRKSFDDLHKLWYVLYKERNLLLTIREKNRRLSSPMTRPDENRYIRVKRSMGAIKFVLNERKKIDALINSKEEHQKVSVSSLDIDSQSNKT